MRTASIVGAEIMIERDAYIQADEDGDPIEAQKHEQKMNELIEEYARIPHPRPA